MRQTSLAAEDEIDKDFHNHFVAAGALEEVVILAGGQWKHAEVQGDEAVETSQAQDFRNLPVAFCENIIRWFECPGKRRSFGEEELDYVSTSRCCFRTDFYLLNSPILRLSYEFR